jgi:hypothetical protein
MRRHACCIVLLLAVFVLAGGVLGCSRQPTSGPSQGQTGQSAPTTLAAAGTRPAETTPIARILDDYAAGRRDEAVAAVLKLYDAQAEDRAWRPYVLSEREAVALPEKERVRLQQEMIDRGVTIRGLGRELRQRAVEAAQRGDNELAGRLVGALRRFGQANQGESVTKLMDLLGKALEELADRPLTPPQTQPGPSGP